MSEDLKQDDAELDIEAELKPVRTFSFFLVFRYAGMLLLFASMFFLFQKHKTPIITFNETQFRNGQVGNLLLTLGTGLFFIYLVHKIYSVIKKS